MKRIRIALEIAAGTGLLAVLGTVAAHAANGL